ncbi:xylulokinase [Tritonibacter horizontis]|uniref:Xylulose kinase n=1 Tax=Tritonibacter horizontis TaxID=1768241 RepID=A0A132C2V7_9RHOB|nr:xylulokinase [Tritonibacter horizontis]KUP94914.1 xylulose kinase [Tritonibacter horizontis]
MYLGLDVGTSGLRALLSDEGGNVIGVADASYGVSHPHTGWSEQDPQDWITACETAVAALRSAHPGALAQLRGIGLSGHMHGATLLDSDGKVLRPCILWNDTRSAAEAAVLDGTDGVRDLSGNIVFPGFTAPKLAWVKAHEPEIFQRIAKVLLPKDYVRYWLTGEFISDMSDSAGTSWLDVGARDWSSQLLEASGMRRDQMPELVEGSAPGGTLRDALRQDWGIRAAVVVAGGGGDNAVAACGAGCFREGEGFVSLGTSGVLLAAKGHYRPDPASAVHTFCHAVPQTWYQMGVILAATDCLNWLSRTLGQTPATLAERLPSRIEKPSSITFLPYLSGERTPHNDASIRASFVGLDIGDGPAEMTQAVMEGVAFALRDCLEALKGTQTDLTRLLAVGGGTQSPYWVETLATVLGIPLDLPDKGEFGAALGAARLAMAATGADLASVMTAPPTSHTIDPRPELAEAFDASYDRYRALYPKMKELMT